MIFLSQREKLVDLVQQGGFEMSNLIEKLTYWFFKILFSPILLIVILVVWCITSILDFFLYTTFIIDWFFGTDLSKTAFPETWEDREEGEEDEDFDI